MARSSPSPRADVDAPSSDLFAAIDAVERCWRDALSFVAGGDATAAAEQVERAGALLARLGPLDDLAARVTAGELPRLAERVQRLSSLHTELGTASRRAQQTLRDELEAARRGRGALAAYGALVPPSHACDAIA
jgi:hypothetical protein